MNFKWLDSHGTYDASDQKFLEKLDQEHRAKAIRINALNELKLATDYLTQHELVIDFFFQ